MIQRAQRFFRDSQEGFSFQEEREFSDKLDYEQEQADNNFIWNDDDDIPDDIDTWLDIDIN